MPVVLEPSWVGRRVSVRRVVDRDPDGRLLLGDVVGDLVGLDAQTAVVDTRSGLVEVPVALVTAARLSRRRRPTSWPWRRWPRGRWRPRTPRPLSGWLLRADDGCTRRANSVLPLRQLKLPLAEALGPGVGLVPRARPAAADPRAGRGAPAARRRAGRARLAGRGPRRTC